MNIARVIGRCLDSDSPFNKKKKRRRPNASAVDKKAAKGINSNCFFQF
jgi:hypothetical protein